MSSQHLNKPGSRLTAEPIDDSVDPRLVRSRARILSAATEIIVESGAGALTVDAVAERSGVAKSTLYRHWPSIKALTIEVIRSNLPTLDPVDPQADFETQLRAQVNVIARTLANPDWVRIMPYLLTLREQLPELDRLAADDRTEKESALASILEVGVAEGRIPAGLDVASVAAVIFGSMAAIALFDDSSQVQKVGEYAVERFLASYPP